MYKRPGECEENVGPFRSGRNVAQESVQNRDAAFAVPGQEAEVRGTQSASTRQVRVVGRELGRKLEELRRRRRGSPPGGLLCGRVERRRDPGVRAVRGECQVARAFLDIFDGVGERLVDARRFQSCACS